jgi:hypothetical protein
MTPGDVVFVGGIDALGFDTRASLSASSSSWSQTG